jgi:hypothetical protein
MSSIASGGIASIPSTLSSMTFSASTIQASTLSLYHESDSTFPILTLSSGYLLLDGQFMSSMALTGVPNYLSSVEVYTSTLYASTIYTREILISTTTSTGSIYADNSDIYYNGLSLTVGNQSSFSTNEIFVSSLYASTIVTPAVLQVQFYSF